jgi:uncharacterized membrane protein YkoI
MIMRSIILGIVIIAAMSSAALASDDHERARKLVKQGDILPLETILQKLPPGSGSVLEVELEHEHGQFVYEIEVLSADGRVNEYIFKATDGELLGVKNED